MSMNGVALLDFYCSTSGRLPWYAGISRQLLLRLHNFARIEAALENFEHLILGPESCERPCGANAGHVGT
jgi:hypothetical protein